MAVDTTKLEEHDSELQKLHLAAAAAAPVAPSKQDLAGYSVELAKLVIGLVESGHLKSRKRYGMAKAVIAAAEVDKVIRAASGVKS